MATRGGAQSHQLDIGMGNFHANQPSSPTDQLELRRSFRQP
jgi:hypothetical protein